MPTTLTLKNVPDALYERLRSSARAHRRSLNGEAIVCLEAALMPSAVDPAERIARLRALHADLGAKKIEDRVIDRDKRQGRP